MAKRLLLGYDIGSSFVKASLVDADTGALIRSASSPSQEMKIDSPQPGWAEQHPNLWWANAVAATKKLFAKSRSSAPGISAIGISYQMHGLVLIDKHQNILRPSIIWCDSRAVAIGNKAFSDLGTDHCLRHFLNSPGNFTASKLKWVKDNEPKIYARISKIMLPGDFIAMKLTGEPCTTISGLSEGVFWDFHRRRIADEILQYYGFDSDLIPEIVPTFGVQGKLTDKGAAELGLKAGIPVSYRAGDQPNNAYSLNVLNPGEVAATAGTSGVIYGVTSENLFDIASRVNAFAHVNYSEEHPNKGVLLCINGTGIQYSWINHHLLDSRYTYEQMNRMASDVEIGSQGLSCFPFGNGAERSLENRQVQGHFSGINFNIHNKGHLIRAAQEGIAFSFRYGLEIMKQMGMEFSLVRAGDSNLFKSTVFQEAIVNSCNVDLEIYDTDGAQGAARGAGVGAAVFTSHKEALKGVKAKTSLHPHGATVKKYASAYERWKANLSNMLGSFNSSHQ